MSIAARRFASALVNTSRSRLQYGTYKPDGTTAGVLPGVARTDYNSSATTDTATLSTAGMVYENLDFYGDIIVAAANITFRNCFFHGGIGHPPYNRGCATMTGNANHNGTEFYDCTFSAQDPSYYRDGIVGNSYKAYRCEAYNTNDAFGAFSYPSGAGNCDVELYGCYAHDLVWWSQDPAHTDGTHNDCLQYQGGSHLRVIGCHFECYVSTDPDSTTTNTRPAPNGKYYGGSAIIVNQNTAAASDVFIENNWFNGGYAQLQLNRGSTYDPLAVSLGVNRYGRDIYDNYPSNPDKRWICLVPSSGTITATNLYTQQIWEDDSTLLTAGRATGIATI